VLLLQVGVLRADLRLCGPAGDRVPNLGKIGGVDALRLLCVCLDNALDLCQTGNLSLEPLGDLDQLFGRHPFQPFISQRRGFTTFLH